MEIIDISVPVRPGMIVYEGDPDVHLERVVSIADGAAANISQLDLGVHTGTHVDAPLHFIEGESGSESLPIDALIGSAHVVDATAVPDALDEASLRLLDLPTVADRLIFKTRNSHLWDLETFSHDFIRLSGDGARHLIGIGVRLVGIDYLSVGDEEAHVELLRVGVIPLEGLDLRSVEPGPYRLICLPLRLVGSDGAPARAILVRD